MARHKDVDWNLAEGRPNGKGDTMHDHATVRSALLMDIRDELKTLNGVLRCFKFQRLPDDIRSIDRRLQQAGFLLRPRKRKN